MSHAIAAGPKQLHSARVLICDDSATIRGAIARILEQDPAIRVVARAGNGQAALEALKLHDIDVVVLDIEMPVMDGLTALPLLLKAQPGLQIVMASTLTERGADISMRALRLGAADYLSKPSATMVAGDNRFGEELIAKIHGLARLRRRQACMLGQPAAAPTASESTRFKQIPGTHHASACNADVNAKPAQANAAHTSASQATAADWARGAAAAVLRPAPRRAPRLLAIGSSTGGPNALFKLVQSLSPALPVPVLITQHMPPSFTPLLADHLNKLGILPCRQARDGDRLRAGEILLAPGDFHMLVKRDADGLAVHLSQAAPENFCRPAVDPMLRSAAAATEARVLTVILTGMGSDGLEGTRGIVEKGGAAIVQDEATSVVWGMPGAVAKAGLAHAILPIDEIGRKVLAMLGIAA